jgi:hypothetical protein
MLNDEFLQAFADFYGSFTLDELAERFGTTTLELVIDVEDLIDDNLDTFTEEMNYDYEEEDDEE